MSLNLRQIEVFRATVEHGTVSGAAQALNVSQPAASKMLSHLEAASGLTLFHRQGRRLALTDTGKRLYQDVLSAFAGMREIERSIETYRRELHGQIVLGIVPPLSGTFIKDVITELRSYASSVYVSVVIRNTEQLIDLLTDKKIDIAIIHKIESIGSGLVQAEIEDPLVCAMSEGHPLATRKSIRLSDLATLPFVAFSPNARVRDVIDKMCDEARITLPAVSDATSGSGVCALTAAFGAISIIPHLAALQLQPHGLIVRPLAVRQTIKFIAIQPPNVHSTKLTERCIEAVRTVGKRTSGLPV